MADESVMTTGPQPQGAEGLWSTLMSLLRTGAVRIETEAEVADARLVCMASTLQLDGHRLLEIDRRVIDRLDLFALHQQQVARQRQRLHRLSALIAYAPWGAMAVGMLGAYAASGEWLMSSGCGLSGLAAMTLLRGLTGCIIGWIIRLFGRRLLRTFGPGADVT